MMNGAGGCTSRSSRSRQRREARRRYTSSRAVSGRIQFAKFRDATRTPRSAMAAQSRLQVSRVAALRGRARIREDLQPVPGIEWIMALRAPAIKKLAFDGVLQLSLFDQTDLAEITHPAFPGERLVACRNPLLAAGRDGLETGTPLPDDWIANEAREIVRLQRPRAEVLLAAVRPGKIIFDEPSRRK